MPKTIQIRNVPEELHRKLKARAAEMGMTLSDYLLSEFQQSVEKPALRKTLAQLDREEPLTVDKSESAAAIIRRHRDAE